MNRRNITPWFRESISASVHRATVLCAVDARYVPLHLLDLEAWKNPALWKNGSDYATAYDALCKQGVALLMDVTDRLISEVRATRWGPLTPEPAKDPEADPYTLDLPHLGTIGAALVAPDGRTAAQVLADIEAKIVAGETDTDALLEQVQLIALLLGV